MLFNFIFRTTAKSSYKLPQFTTKTSNPHSFTVTYLITSCGVSPESAISASKRLDLSKSPNFADSVLAFLNNQGFTISQVSKVICRYPRILLCDPEKTLLPNFQILENIGLSRTDLNAIVTARPKAILHTKVQDTALPSVDYLRTVLGSDDLVITAIKRFPLALTYDLQVYAAENVRMLLEVGAPDATIRAFLARQPRTFFTSADRFRKVVRDVMEMGFDPSKYRFLWAIHAIRAMSKLTWDKKLEIYKKWGWSKDEIFIAFERCPGCMMASTDKIARMLDFLVNTMGWESSFIVQWPIVISFSLEKRVIPRCLVYQYVAEKGLVEEQEDFCFTKWLMYSEKKFLKWVVKRYEDEAPEILKLYRKHLNEANGSTTSILRKRDVI
ncbi:putative transcription regulator mTERF family [Helianthus annuus]|nr:putative transcription regulator mTERF family [Helianthus annuus]KAJ0573474.1 putative transcription regulator mTERF family [Helianthus annuus]KAJ0740733.1 putative transcription regulator mTERF family [Helianthus annuus]